MILQLSTNYMPQQTLDTADNCITQVDFKNTWSTGAITTSIYFVDIEPNKDQKDPYST